MAPVVQLTQGGPVHEGTFVDGPLDGLTYTIESDKGVLAISREADAAWLYRLDGDSAVTPTTYSLVIDGDADPFTGARAFNEDKAIRAAEDGYDVIADPGDAVDAEELAYEEVLTDGE
jgi:hypothetical protein